MSEFTKVLDRIHENLENCQPMFDGIEFKTLNGDWKQAICLDQRTELFRVKPVVTGMFSVDALVELFNKHSRGIGYSASNLFTQDLANSLNEFVESKLDSIREQAIRDFIGCNISPDDDDYNDWIQAIDFYASEKLGSDCGKYKNAFVQGLAAAEKESPYLQGSGNSTDKPEGQLVKGPERGESRPVDEQTITVKIPTARPAGPIPEQRIIIQPGDYVPHELITSEAVFNLVIQAFSAALHASAFSLLIYKGWQAGKSTAINKGIGITSDKEEITLLSISAKRPLTLQQLFNATNGFEWPEGTNYITDTCGSVMFCHFFDPITPGIKVLATRVK